LGYQPAVTILSQLLGPVIPAGSTTFTKLRPSNWTRYMED